MHTEVQHLQGIENIILQKVAAFFGSEMLVIRPSYLFIPFMGSASTKRIMINGTFANYLLSADEKSAACELP